MHFLCLHGIGANSHVLETQIAPLRHEMDGHHTFEFVEGSVACSADPEIKAFFPSNDKYFRYFEDKAESISKALSQLSTYISEEGPFDGVIAFSQGAALVSTYLISLDQQQPHLSLPFRCAIFFSGGRPADPQALGLGKERFLEPTQKNSPLRLPTANIWGRRDLRYGAASEILSLFFEESQREIFIHGGVHEIPGARAQEDLQKCVKAIRRTIEKASIDC